MDEKKKRRVRWVFGGALIVLGIVLLFLVRSIIGPFIVAYVLAYLLNPLVERLEKYKIKRKLSIAFVFLGIIGVIALTLFIILPVLYNEISKISARLPQVMETLNQQMIGWRGKIEGSGLPEQILTGIDNHIHEMEGNLGSSLDRWLDNLPKFLGSLTYYALSPFMAIYFLADWKRMGNWFIRLVPNKFRMEWFRLWQDINHVLRRFIRGNLVVAVIVGLLIGIGVKIIGMDYALLIGLICGVCDLIPYFGPFIGAIPAVLLGLTKSTAMAFKIIVVIIVVQQLEGNYISPKLMGDSVGLHPIGVVFALLAGESIAGFWGMVIAVPLAAVLRVIIRYIYFRLVSPENDLGGQ